MLLNWLQNNEAVAKLAEQRAAVRAESSVAWRAAQAAAEWEDPMAEQKAESRAGQMADSKVALTALRTAAQRVEKMAAG